MIVELLLDSTASIDRGLKKEIYQDTFRTLEYFWFDPANLEFEGFSLMRGRYEPILPNGQGQRWSDQLQLFLGIHDEQLRFYKPDGSLVPTPEEAARIEQQRADTEQQRGDRLAERVRALGIDPDGV